MIGRAGSARHRSFHGVDIDVLASGREGMVTKMRFKAGDHVPFHTHPNVQSGYVLSGRMRLRTREVDEILGPGDSYSVPADVEHSIEVVDAGEVIDVFVPPREDLL